MGISDTVAIVTCSLCNVLEFLCFVVIIFEMPKRHVINFRLFLSKVDIFTSGVISNIHTERWKKWLVNLFLLSRTWAEPGRTVKQGDEISHNHKQTFSPLCTYTCTCNP